MLTLTSGLVGLIIFFFDVYAIVQILASSATPVTKVLWCLAIIMLPILGLIAWYFMGPKRYVAA